MINLSLFLEGVNRFVRIDVTIEPYMSCGQPINKAQGSALGSLALEPPTRLSPCSGFSSQIQNFCTKKQRGGDSNPW